MRNRMAPAVIWRDGKHMKNKKYLTPNEVAELLMVSPVTVRQWAQKGQLKAETTPGGHRRFLIHEIERFAREHDLALQRPDDNRFQILIVDDDKQLTRYLSEFFSDYRNVVIEIAHNGFEAGQKVQRFKPDLMLLDLMMPGISGIEVCRELKSDPATKAIRVVAMTGHYSQENVNAILSAGAEACLKKPLDINELRELIGAPLHEHT